MEDNLNTPELESEVFEAFRRHIKQLDAIELFAKLRRDKKDALSVKRTLRARGIELDVDEVRRQLRVAKRSPKNKDAVRFEAMLKASVLLYLTDILTENDRRKVSLRLGKWATQRGIPCPSNTPNHRGHP